MSKIRRKASIEKPWLQYYPESLRNFVPSEDTLTDLILKHNGQPHKEIIEYYGRRFTLNEVFVQADKVAKGFVALGVKENVRIVVFLRAVP